ncbi:hypothetical protein IWW39_000327 [Coemansia spiralis]|uniref:Uncharacterized protein n=1 Tax=Coemansia spiralis TaxID=417178 RepID=A0A9W8L7A3_9FUNG|nr:hypothetical protein IWW39_000327 [Coemansia spiralis]
MNFTKLSGTGTGTPFPAATDVAKESGTLVFGGVELVDDTNSPHYIGHGVGHRDPKTGAPLSANIHIPTRGETHPSEFTVVNQANVCVVSDRERLESKYGIQSPGKYHANWYKTKSKVNGTLAKMTGSQKHLDKAVMQRDLAELELNAYVEENGGYTFAKH